MITTIINILTLSRIAIALIIFMSLAFKNYYLFSFILFFIASFTDYLDGFLARKYNASSEMGEILDPVADKILIVFLFFGLALNLSSNLIGFAAALIIAREIWVSSLRDYNARKNNIGATKVIYIAKIKTSMQLTTIATYIAGLAFGKMLLIVIADVMLIIAVLITIYTGFVYTLNTFQN
tara:strand:+ start:868 stop:1407 length:540 start_codon:yes stop_codon:yes gene_type:complete